MKTAIKILLLVLVVQMQPATAGLLGVAKVPFKHPIATAVLAAGGYATIKSYCAAGGPAVRVDDGTGHLRSMRIDCSELKAVAGEAVSTAKNTLARVTTQTLRRNLAGEQTTQGFPPDPDDCDAHHIVAKGAASARIARDAIDGCVGINDAENGVYLPRNRAGSQQCKGAHHRTLHTRDYYNFVNYELERARNEGGCMEVRQKLRLIKEMLMRGQL